MQLKLIKTNSQDVLVESWQNFLRGQNLFHSELTGSLDAATKAATITFQKKHGLQPDGEVGNKSFGEGDAGRHSMNL